MLRLLRFCLQSSLSRQVWVAGRCFSFTYVCLKRESFEAECYREGCFCFFSLSVPLFFLSIRTHTFWVCPCQPQCLRSTPDCRWEELFWGQLIWIDVALNYYTCVFNTWTVGTQMTFNIFICTWMNNGNADREREKERALLLLGEREWCVQKCLCSSACQLYPPS